ncbi:hypothetical protein [Campylobacter coli]|uniref:hypothetical protein n=2 Tax=Campylobacter coli TaxID=195 RepID=UPI000A6FC478|nr:hypothetical protein [Campylobacter coli]
MTAYVHMGTMKTGTTSIQKFLYTNKGILEKYNCCYPISIKNHFRWAHHSFIGLLLQSIKSNKQNLQYNQYSFSLQKELSCNQYDKVIITSENIQYLFIDEKHIVEFKKIIKKYGFKKIYIIIYLRDPLELYTSLCSQSVKDAWDDRLINIPIDNSKALTICHHQNTLQKWMKVFGKENIIVRLFDKNEFYQGDLLKDFIHSIGLKWDDKFQIPEKENETLDLIGFELQQRLNCYLLGGYEYANKNGLTVFTDKHFQNSKDPHLKFQPPKEIIQSYVDYFEESNEWVRKEFFPHKERLFPKKDLTNYKENYELKEMKPEYWDKIAEFIADIVKTKNQAIIDKEQTIQNQKNKIQSLEKTKDNLYKYSKHGTAKSRIQNQLSYKLGQAMIVNSKSLLGYIRMPFVLSYIKDKHKQEQKIYQEKIKKDPSLKLPPLESYLDYKEALKEKECFTYKLGEALIKANNNWYGGGYIKLWFEIRKLKK